MGSSLRNHAKRAGIYCFALAAVAHFSGVHAHESDDARATSTKEIYNRGAAIYHGIGVEPDPVLGCKYFADAMEQGDPMATFNLANCYRDGHMGDVDLQAAELLYVKAAGMGIADAFVSIGVMHLEDSGGRCSARAANQLFRIALAADKDNAYAAYHYGVSLMLGRGVLRDRPSGWALIQKAADLGHYFALATAKYVSCSPTDNGVLDAQNCDAFSYGFEDIRRVSHIEKSYDETIAYLSGKGWLPE